jgi:hypothetical protein
MIAGTPPSSSAPQVNFDVRKNGLRFGPHTTEELKELLANGRVDAGDAVIKESGEEVSVGTFLGVESTRSFKPITPMWRGNPADYVEPAGNLRWVALAMGVVWFGHAYAYYRYRRTTGEDGDFALGSALGNTLGVLLVTTILTVVIRLITRRRGLARATCQSFISIITLKIILVWVAVLLRFP